MNKTGQTFEYTEATEGLAMPLPLTDFARLCADFEKRHKGCALTAPPLLARIAELERERDALLREVATLKTLAREDKEVRLKAIGEVNPHYST